MPGGPGGRPHNAWDFCGGHRIRKLVRLYTLTNLTKKEIQRVLKADGFKPSESDIQKKLRSLFPKDYAKDHRTYRPSGRASVKFLLSRLHRCKDGRISKYQRKGRAGGLSTRPKSPSWYSRIPTENGLEILHHAFRNYSADTTTEPSIVLSSIYSTESQPVFSSMLMLDGSSIGPKTTTYVPLENYEGRRRHQPSSGKGCAVCGLGLEIKKGSEWFLPFSCGHLSHEICFFEYMKEQESRSCPVCIDQRDKYASTRLENVTENESTAEAVRNTELPDGKGQNFDDSDKIKVTGKKIQEQSTVNTRASALEMRERKRISIMTLDSLKRRLSNRSSMSIQHIYSVLRLSSSDSDRSSTSWRSSWISRLSRGSSREHFQEKTTSLSQSEGEIWAEIIDESHLVPPVGRRPSNDIVFPRKRSCCDSKQPNDISCSECGFSFSFWHCENLLILRMSTFQTAEDDQTDRFGNNPLHYAAAAGLATCNIVSSLVSNGFNIAAKNVSGQNFLHVLSLVPLSYPLSAEELRRYASLLTYLKEIKFPLADRDFHGRTAMHLFFSENRIPKHGAFSGQVISEIIAAINNLLHILDWSLLNSLDNQGYKLTDLLESWCNQVVGGSSIMNFHYKPFFRGRNPDGINFLQNLSLETWRFEERFKSLKDGDFLSWVDKNGDTPLTAILKKCNDEDHDLQLREMISLLVQSGVEVNMRDRNGNTALAIATIMGSRPCVARLLDLGALPNSRNYDGTSIITAATERMQRAKFERNNKFYARIFSCVTLLAANGAVAEPSEVEEWMPRALKHLA